VGTSKMTVKPGMIKVEWDLRAREYELKQLDAASGAIVLAEPLPKVKLGQFFRINTPVVGPWRHPVDNERLAEVVFIEGDGLRFGLRATYGTIA
jgi:hypothetical protein